MALRFTNLTSRAAIRVFAPTLPSPASGGGIKRRGLAAGALLAALTGAASAQSTLLPELLVISPSLEPIAASKAGSSVTMMTGDEARATGFSQLSDVIRTFPGVAVNQSGSRGSLTQFRVRRGGKPSARDDRWRARQWQRRSVRLRAHLRGGAVRPAFPGRRPDDRRASRGPGTVGTPDQQTGRSGRYGAAGRVAARYL